MKRSAVTAGTLLTVVCLISTLLLCSLLFPAGADAYIARSASTGSGSSGIASSKSTSPQPAAPAPRPSPPDKTPVPAPAPASKPSPLTGSLTGYSPGSYGIARSYSTFPARTIFTGFRPSKPAPPAPQPDSGDSVNLNRLEEQLLILVNNERTRSGLAPLSVDSRLTRLARLKSQDMIENNYFAHRSPVYGSFGDMLRENNIRFNLAAENIGMGGSIKAIFSAFMNSSAHRSKIMDPRYTHTGIGVKQDSRRGYIVTQHFMQPR
jgi:uncharacterized protein YkwD